MLLGLIIRNFKGIVPLIIGDLFSAMEEKLLYKIRVTGRVQGVGFRWSAVREAIYLGITGYVKNLSDGSVYIEAEGSRKHLNDFVDWCRKGPGFGHVGSVTTDIYPPVNYTEFTIKY